jgi:hypothetical protein
MFLRERERGEEAKGNKDNEGMGVRISRKLCQLRSLIDIFSALSR